MSLRRPLIGVMALFFFFSTNANAMRCGTSLVIEGTEEFTVNSHCGKPIDTEWVVLAPWGVVKKAIYDMGRGRFVQIVIFDDGRVVDIRNGPRR